MKGAQEIWLLKALRIQTSPGALQSTRQGTNSQKCEAVNHAFSMTNPKSSLTFHRNGKNRDASSIQILNNGPGTSIARKLKVAGIPMSTNSRAVQRLMQLDR